MRTLTIDVCPPAESTADFVRAWRTGQPQDTSRLSFATPELLWQTLTAKRWVLLKVLLGAGPVSIREAARRTGRDVRAVHGDIAVLVGTGVLDRTKEDAVVFPFDSVKVEFSLRPVVMS